MSKYTYVVGYTAFMLTFIALSNLIGISMVTMQDEKIEIPVCNTDGILSMISCLKDNLVFFIKFTFISSPFKYINTIVLTPLIVGFLMIIYEVVAPWK